MSLLLLKMEEVESRVFASKEVVRDVHLERAVEIFGVSPNQVTPDMRRFAKQNNYLRLYSPQPRILSLTEFTERYAYSREPVDITPS
jgi:hypothetical protein